MVRITKHIRNLLGGISQQPDAIRFENQVEDAENVYPSFTEGMRKRANTEHIAELLQTAGGHGNFKYHLIDRDDDERYLVMVGNLSVRVFDMSNGNELTVLTPDGVTYLGTSGSNTNTEVFRTVTVADVTYVVNTETEVELKAGLTSERDDEALIFIKNGGGQKTVFTITGDLDAQFIANDSAVTGFLLDQRTNEIAEHLADNPTPGTPPAGTGASTGLKQDGSWSTPPWNVDQKGSTVWVYHDTTDFDLDVWDSRSSTLVEYIKDTEGIDAFTSLPAIAPHGFKTLVKGQPGDEADDYWVEFTADDGVFSSGYWSETVKPGIQYQFNLTTMPHLLIRSSDTDANGPIFVFQKADGQTPAGPAAAGDDYSEFTFLDRTVGDEVTNPNPSFVGQKINNIFFAKNRLGFLSGENVILSEAGEFFNFWRITTAALLDTAPIDLSSPGQGVALFRSAASFQDRVLLFSDSAQFSLQGDPLLTPSTATLTQLTEYESTFLHEPASADNSLFFPFKRGASHSGVREYRLVDAVTDTFGADDITSHVASLIDGNIHTMSVDTVEGLLAVVDTEGGLHVYRWLDSTNGARQLSCWTRVTFGSDCLVRAAYFVDSKLYLAIDRKIDSIGEYELFLESVEFDSVMPADANGAAFRTLLDRRIDESDLTGVFSYDAGNDETTIQMPYRRVDREFAVMSRNDGSDTEGTQHVVVSQPPIEGTNIVVEGDVTGDALWLGEKYPMTLELSRQYPRVGDEVRVDGRVQFQWLQVGFGPLSALEVSVVHKSGPTYTTVLQDSDLSITPDLTNTIKYTNGGYLVPIRGRSEEVTITLGTDEPYPCAVFWADAVLEFDSKLQRLR